MTEKSNEDFMIEATPGRATFTMRGLVVLDAKIGPEDIGTVGEILGSHMPGGEQEKINTCMREIEGGRSELVMGDYASTDDRSGTYLTVHFDVPPEHGWCDFKLIVGQERLARIWREGAEDIRAGLEARIGELFKDAKTTDEVTKVAFATRHTQRLPDLIEAILRFADDEVSAHAVVERFETWLTVADRVGGVRISRDLPNRVAA